MKPILFSLLLIATLLVNTHGSVAQEESSNNSWVSSWTSSLMPSPENPAQAPPAFTNTTLRQVIHISKGGNQLRLRFANDDSLNPLSISGVTVAHTGAKSSIISGSVRDVTFAGIRTVSIAPGSEIYSDPVSLALNSLSDVTVSMYFEQASASPTYHRQGLQDAFVSTPGNHIHAMDIAVAKTTERAYFLNGLEVDAPYDTPLIVAFGDSITNGTSSTSGTNRRWPDYLARRLDGNIAVVNQSIAGNRLLHDFVGKNGLERFDRDVLSLPQASHVIVLLGTNDIGYTRYSEEVFDEGIYAGDITVEDLIAGYRSLITKAHANNIRIIGGTLPPFQGSGHYSTTTETIRQAVNQWIRESGEFDDVIDFDLVLRDPQNTSKLNPALQADWLHPNDAGYEAMAETIPLLLFAL